MLRLPGPRRSLLALLALAALGVTACNKAASEVACERADDIIEGVADIDEAVRDGELDDAREDVRDLRRDFDSLVRRMPAIDNTAEDSIEPLIGPADAAIIGLEMAGTVDEIAVALDAGRQAIEAIALETDSALACT